MSTEKYSHGRGGIGNIGADQVSYVDGLAYSPPKDRHPKFSTGRGGAGNILKYDPSKVVVAQDVPQSPYHAPVTAGAGRGGWGNISEKKKMEKKARQSMEEGRRSTDSTDSTSSKETGIADLAKEALFKRSKH